MRVLEQLNKIKILFNLGEPKTNQNQQNEMFLLRTRKTAIWPTTALRLRRFCETSSRITKMSKLILDELLMNISWIFGISSVISNRSVIRRWPAWLWMRSASWMWILIWFPVCR